MEGGPAAVPLMAAARLLAWLEHVERGQFACVVIVSGRHTTGGVRPLGMTWAAWSRLHLCIFQQPFGQISAWKGLLRETGTKTAAMCDASASTWIILRRLSVWNEAGIQVGVSRLSACHCRVLAPQSPLWFLGSLPGLTPTCLLPAFLRANITDS